MTGWVCDFLTSRQTLRFNSNPSGLESNAFDSDNTRDKVMFPDSCTTMEKKRATRLNSKRFYLLLNIFPSRVETPWKLFARSREQSLLVALTFYSRYVSFQTPFRFVSGSSPGAMECIPRHTEEERFKISSIFATVRTIRRFTTPLVHPSMVYTF